MHVSRLTAGARRSANAAAVLQGTAVLTFVHVDRSNVLRLGNASTRSSTGRLVGHNVVMERPAVSNQCVHTQRMLLQQEHKQGAGAKAHSVSAHRRVLAAAVVHASLAGWTLQCADCSALALAASAGLRLCWLALH